MATPDFVFTNAWAYTNETNAPFPPATQQVPNSGRTSIALGFPRETMIPIANGGVPPYGQDMNGILRAITSNLVHFAKGGMWEYSSAITYTVPAMVWYNGAFYECIATTTGNLPTNETYWKKVTDSGDTSVLVGSIVPFAGQTLPEGYLKCDGSAVSRTTYANLYNAIGTTWGTGNGSTTFNLPNAKSRTLWGATVGGGYINSGLPNITGTFVSINVDATGAFSNTGTRSHDLDIGGKALTYWKDFSASRSNSIYGASTIVQPPALNVMFLIKY